MLLNGPTLDLVSGVAWRPNARMVVRGGYGITYDALMGMEQDWKGIAGSWPATGSLNPAVSLNQLGQPLSPIQDNLKVYGVGLPSATPWGQQNWYFDPHRGMGDRNSGMLKSREMSRNLVVSIGYVGSKSDRLDATGLWDTAQTPGPGTAAEVQARKPFPWYTQTNFYGTDRGFSHYNSLQAKANRHFSNGLQYLVSYTWSKTTDAGGSGWFGAENGPGGNSALQNYYDLNGSRGLSPLDASQVLAINGLYELPVGRGKAFLNHGPADSVFGNWQTNMTLELHSGQPFNLTVPGDVANIGNTVSWFTYARPNLVGNAKQGHLSKNEWFNTDAFAVPSFWPIRECARDFLRAPHVADTDFSLFKNFPLGEKATLSFRAEAFNIFNIQNYGVPDLNFGDPTFGVISSNVLAPRELQMGLHLQY